MRITLRPLLILAFMLALGAVAGRDWIGLAKQALTYPTTRRGETANIAVRDTLVFATLAEDGLAIVSTRTGRRLAGLTPPPGSQSIDDVAIAGDLLFVLDARAPGFLSVFSLAEPLQPRLVSPPLAVPVEPFAGVSATAGIAVVSGGTSRLTAWRYDREGILEAPAATADLGRGQPDVLLAATRRLAYVSTHYSGPSFGLDIVGLERPDTRLEKLGRLKLDGAGFTVGGARPATFPIEAAELSADTVLVAHGSGLAIIGTADPSRPRLLARIDLGGPAVSVDALGPTAAVSVSGGHPAIVLVDFGGAAPRIVRRLKLPPGTLPASVALIPERVMVAAGRQGVLVFDR